MPFEVQAYDEGGRRWLASMSTHPTIEGAEQFLADVRDENAWSGRLRILETPTGTVRDVQDFAGHPRPYVQTEPDDC